MFELRLLSGKCPNCDHQIQTATDQVLSLEFHPLSAFLLTAKKTNFDFCNCVYLSSYAEVDKSPWRMYCTNCDAEIIYTTGIICANIRKNNNDECKKRYRTFASWLNKQEHRNDPIGDLAREYNWSKKSKNQKKAEKYLIPPKNSNDFVAMYNYYEQYGKSFLKSFLISWNEFLLYNVYI